MSHHTRQFSAFDTLRESPEVLLLELLHLGCKFHRDRPFQRLLQNRPSRQDLIFSQQVWLRLPQWLERFRRIAQSFMNLKTALAPHPILLKLLRACA